jgi:hypothetical protein
MIRFYTQVFSDAGVQYSRMAKVLQRSAKAHGVDVTINYISDSDTELRGSLHGTYYQNCRKTKHHAELIDRQDTGDIVALLDADMLVLKPLLPDLEELMAGRDLAITYRPPHHRFLLNSGMVATRVNPLTRQLHWNWAKRAAKMMQEPKLYRQYASRYGGINQSALGSLLEEEEWNCLKLLGLTTLEWNATVLEHSQSLEKSRIVHLLGALRKYCLHPGSCPSKHFLAPLVAAWEQHADSFDNVSGLR